MLPFLIYKGRRFSGEATDYEDFSGKVSDEILSGAFTISFTACWDRLPAVGTILDFGSGPERVNIFVGSHSATLAFHIRVASSEFRLDNTCIVPGEVAQFLCSVSADGHMRIFKNGELLGEKVDGTAPECKARNFLYIGRSHVSRGLHPFDGTIQDIAVWNAEVGVSEALEYNPSGNLSKLPPSLSPPVVRYGGRDFSGSASDFHDLGNEFVDVAFGGPISIAFTARWDSLEVWSRIIDFGNGPESCNIFIANRGPKPNLSFNIWVGSHEFRCEARDAIVVGESHRYLCTVDARGHMRIFCDGKQVGDNPRGVPPTFGIRRFLYVARSNWTRDKPFHGMVKDLAVWNAALSWDATVQIDAEKECDGTALRPSVTSYDTKEPVIVYDGRQFTGALADFEDLGPRYGDIVFGSAFSIAFFARWDGLQPWSRIIDFGNGPEGGNIFIATYGMTRDMAFHVWVGSFEAKLRVQEAIIPGKTNRYLCTVSETGHMKVWRDARLLAEEFHGVPPSYGTRRFLYVGRSNWERDRPFTGMITELSVWNAVVSWEESKTPNLKKQWEDHKHEWECQGIVRKDDGMWCTWCEKGPMTSATVVQRHIEAKGHQKQDNNNAAKLGLEKAWETHQKKWQRQGIERKDDGFWCTFCEKGPFVSTKMVEQHFDGKGHQKFFDQSELKSKWEEHQQEWESQGLECRDDGMWCTYCDKGPMLSAKMVEQHIEGRLHQTKVEQCDLNKVWDEHQERWEPQSIVLKKDDGFWCIWCDKGPMHSASVVDGHIKAKGHQKNATPSKPLELPAEYVTQGIVPVETQLNLPTNAYRCKLCNAGPFNALVVIDAHLQSKKHKKETEKRRAADPTWPDAIKQSFPACSVEKSFEVQAESATRVRFNLRAEIIEHSAEEVEDDYVLVEHTDANEHVEVEKPGDQADSLASLRARNVDIAVQLEAALVTMPWQAENIAALQSQNSDLKIQLGAALGAAPSQAGMINTLQTEVSDLEILLKAALARTSGEEETTAASQATSPPPQMFAAAVQSTDGAKSRDVDDILSDAKASSADQIGGCSHSAVSSSQTTAAEDLVNDSVQSATDCSTDEVRSEMQDTGEGEPNNALSTKLREPIDSLPPGWTAVWHAETSQYYYADLEEQAAQWEAPPAYVHGAWSRQADPAGRVFWECLDFDGCSFYEHGDSGWIRLVDREGRFYWSHPPTRTRFFEEDSSSIDADPSMRGRPGGA